MIKGDGPAKNILVHFMLPLSCLTVADDCLCYTITGSENKKPVRQFIGEITDASLVERACKGAQCIMHVASIVDTTMFPNYDLSYKINVEGKNNL